MIINLGCWRVIQDLLVDCDWRIIDGRPRLLFAPGLVTKIAPVHDLVPYLLEQALLILREWHALLLAPERWLLR